ncbi:hypothetical protein EASAB2608_07333 [Streptomyces sp. EAS-AB2608]|uniref:GMC family oxidoreductase N-terminal domain-containing protein n=1 Tax=Streptomyces sp. EAS-AB2608 TaxID=2779671 RepID=UPI001BED745B|nr:hypothetical protein EASAB2608_07333 [Streptomyces sp. EAS-AB2608]
MYDYVIVGAGSAGCVLAARLSEDPDVRVALIEAGGPDTAQEIHVPAAFPQLFKSELDWDLDSDPEPGIGGRRTYLPRGKVFGGSSSINAVIYIRGNRADYDGRAAAGADRLGLRRRTPVLRTLGGQRARRGHLPRGRRTTDGQRRQVRGIPSPRPSCGPPNRPGTRPTTTSTVRRSSVSAATS